MLVRVFTLPFESRFGGFDDTALRDFVKDKEVLSVRDHFFAKDELPFLTVVVTYNLLRPEYDPPVRTGAESKKTEAQEAWRQLLEEADWPLFNTLRDWRNGQAKEEGVPPYVICTNRQLAEIAHRRPESLNKLGAIERLGKAKLDRYGAAILKLVAEVSEGGNADEPGGQA